MVRGAAGAGSAAVAIGASPDRITAAPVWFGLLVMAVFALDGLSVDLFERGNVSPGSVGTLALAFMFGPLGPLAAELAVAVKRIVARDPAVRWIFDIGALGLAGAAAAGTFEVATESAGLGVLLASLLGAASYYVVNVSLLALVMVANEHRDPFGVWRERLAWLAPQYVAFGLLAGGLVLTHEALGALRAADLRGAGAHARGRRAPVREPLAFERRPSCAGSHGELERANQRLRELLDDNDALLRGMHRSYLSTITSLARTIEAKDPYTGGHTERVAEFACCSPPSWGSQRRGLDAIEVGGVIHDIGKIGVPDAVLLKPGSLTEDEFADDAPAPDDLELHPRRARPAADRQADGAQPPRALRRHRLPGRARRRGDPARRPDPERRRRARRDDQRPSLPRRAAGRRRRCDEIAPKRASSSARSVVDALLACVDRQPSLGRRFVRQQEPRPPPS